MAKSILSALCLACALGGAGWYISSAAAAEADKTQATESMVVVPSQPLAQEDQVSINQATAEQLSAAMEGIGLKKAQSIVRYREQYGAFTALDQLREVPGIGQLLIERNAGRLKL